MGAYFFKENLEKMDNFDQNDVMNIKDTDENNLIHIFIIDKKKRGKKLTRLKGLGEEFDFKKILAHLKKAQKCNGAIKNDEKTGQPIIELSGDHREAMEIFLYDEGICEKEHIRVHGI